MGLRNGWLVALRLVTFSLICGIIILWMGYPSYLHGPLLSYCIVTLATFVALLLARRYPLAFLLRFLLALHFVAEIACEAEIVFTTGNLYSPFAALFLLTIVSAALIYRLVGTLIMASLVSLAYVAVTWLNAALSNLGNQAPSASGGGIFSADDILFYSTFLHILIFYLVAFISGYLAERLQTKDRELLSASVELRQARLATGDILRHLNSGLLTMDSQGEIVVFNRAAETILGLPAGQVSGRTCREVFVGRLAALGGHLEAALREQPRGARAELEIITADGRPVPIGISVSILHDEQYRLRGIIAIFQDITQAKIMEERVRQADRMAAVGELSACMAHEIRNPLAAISGSVEVLKADLRLEGDNDRLMALIVTETSRLNKLLSDFLSYTRIGRLRFQKVELNQVISDIIEMVRRHPAFSRNVRIELRSLMHITYVSGDEGQLKQILLNVVVNACEALGDRGGSIIMEVSHVPDPDRDAQTCVAVRDDGPGIAAEHIDKIFLPFFSTKSKGTGLGLALVARLVEAHGGRIEVASHLGRGTEFRLYFRGIGEESPVAIPARPVSFS